MVDTDVKGAHTTVVTDIDHRFGSVEENSVLSYLITFTQLFAFVWLIGTMLHLADREFRANSFCYQCYMLICTVLLFVNTGIIGLQVRAHQPPLAALLTVFLVLLTMLWVWDKRRKDVHAPASSQHDEDRHPLRRS